MIKLKPVLLILNKYKNLFVTVAVLGICGYTAYQISLVVAVTPNAAAVEAERAKVDTSNLKFDTKTIDSITKQHQINVSTNLSGIGTSNPFYGN